MLCGAANQFWCWQVCAEDYGPYSLLDVENAGRDNAAKWGKGYCYLISIPPSKWCGRRGEKPGRDPRESLARNPDDPTRRQPLTPKGSSYTESHYVVQSETLLIRRGRPKGNVRARRLTNPYQQVGGGGKRKSPKRQIAFPNPPTTPVCREKRCPLIGTVSLGRII